MLEHEEEIMARPARTWFQTERQKKELARRSREAAENGATAGQGGARRLAASDGAWLRALPAWACEDHAADG